MECLMPFIVQDKLFTHGFECGQIWELARNGNAFNEYYIHAINEEQIKIILELYNYQYTIERLNDPWCILSAINKSGLN